MLQIDYEQRRILHYPPRDEGGGSGGGEGQTPEEHEHISSLAQTIISAKDFLCSCNKKRLAPVVLTLGLAAVTLGGSVAPGYQYWEHAFLNLRQSGVSLKENPEEWAEVLGGLFKTMPTPEAVEVGPGGYLYEFSLAAEGAEEAVIVTFPPELGGGTQTLSLDGTLKLLVGEPPADCTNEEGAAACEAPMWIVDMEEKVHGLRLPIGGRDVEIKFVVDKSMFTREMQFDPDRPQGTMNRETGEYELTYSLRPTHPMLAELGIDDVGTVVVDERGRIGFDEYGNAVSIEMGGKLTITEGPYQGTIISYGRVPLDQSNNEEDTEQKN